MELPLFIVDAFTSQPFAGNPAAICFLSSDDVIPDHTKQRIAFEMNLSETAFVSPVAGSPDTFVLRWFTPSVEVALCGHATLATAHALFHLTASHPTFAIHGERITFRTKSGELFVSKATAGMLQLDFPAGAPADVTLDAALLHDIMSFLALSASDVVNVAFCGKTKKLFVEVCNVEQVLCARPSVKQLLTLQFPGLDVRGIAVTTRGVASNPRYAQFDFVSRYFAPWNGIDEDPVTGSAHTALAVYWQSRLQKSVFNAHQASSRGGDLLVEVTAGGRVLLAGHSVTTLRGTFSI
eukprot:TRINITY_DN8521_c0_g1_i1.p1 TRINITY_DN8521_c0_g1~~TRINITY_DN8521_c0_g1_i1.p1  ORF type:complete len:295 (-),score=75.80 TRINITY_DN8521_c0_g1_i1:447-1331(-)